MRRVRCSICSLLVAVVLFPFALLPQSSMQTNARLPARRSESAAGTLQRWYVPEAGLYATTGWWNSANAITALTNFMQTSGSRQYVPVLANTFTQAQVAVPKDKQTGRLRMMTGFPGFLNQYYDDEGWWALAWIDAYDLTGEARYLTMAQSIFQDMAGGWDGTCGGGIWWSKDRNYKNAIANELFFSVAAHLATRGNAGPAQQAYSDWADREWRWFQSSGMINNDHLINDGLTIDKTDGSCRNNGKTTWTYNQGVILGALAEFSRGSHDPNASLNAAMHARIIADAALAHLTDNSGVLHDPCEPDKCGEDAPQFKGIFVRNLSELNSLVQEQRYDAFFSANAESIWTQDRDASDALGLVWSGPAGKPDAATHSSALDVLNAGLASQR